ncbi:L-threonylcarbamoyladenylate synthase [Legionella oakridgensis]|uniref:Threonylcarbamoyl-AMP synthase n=2 Tax=Legionella oakridgensis TaxID=29423 RepID=W0BCD3_9GAMM|nr:L-threonylcarbamoyladenylate synthase [Legionella oakridgensis]AHE66079.1 Sua5/YciO/YrdC/YwlC family protein [Legionella oakridgensis ATCC 33761 = DSM 21215]KTD43831.1 translation initiation protein [Legionella oakridgensis]STY15998.1 translation initiation protein [Legionella longbeachae]
MRIIDNIEKAQELLSQGKIIAYPTEAVYGLGCDPFNQWAVERLLALKKRAVDKGLIVLIADWTQLSPLIDTVPEALLSKVKKSWPGPVTWVFPKSKIVPDWLSGHRDTIAIRMSAHPIARQLCYSNPIISTSANVSGKSPARDVESLSLQFPQGIDAIIAGELGGESQPSAIFEVFSGKRLR